MMKGSGRKVGGEGEGADEGSSCDVKVQDDVATKEIAMGAESIHD